MRPYVVSLSAGILVGVVYGVLKVRSPAPPVIALFGLLGMLVGEQLVPIVRNFLEHRRVDVSQIGAACKQHMFGRLPEATGSAPKSADVPTKKA